MWNYWRWKLKIKLKFNTPLVYIGICGIMKNVSLKNTFNVNPIFFGVAKCVSFNIKSNPINTCNIN